MVSQELSIRNRNSEEMAGSEFGAMERHARCALFYPDQRFKVAVPEYQRQARDAVNQAVREAPEKYEEIQGIQTRYAGRMEENERRVAQVMGSEAREALRGPRSQRKNCMNIKYLS